MGDTAFLVTLAGTVDAAMLGRVRALAARLVADRPAGVLEIVPAYSSVAVLYEPERVRTGVGELPWHAVAHWIERHLAGEGRAAKAAASRQHEIPVCYGGEHGPDLEAVARMTGLSAAEVVKLHSGASYTVAAVGFTPGFPYLLGLPEKLAVARRATPRVRVPAGSVGLGGAQTGIYPRETPGGWQLIGRTGLELFNPAEDPPARLAAGDRVVFRAVEKFTALRGNGQGSGNGGSPAHGNGSSGGRGAGSASPRGGFLEVLRPGALATVQDLGRVGLAGQGVGRGGALDPWAALAANLTVGNPPEAPLLECAYVGPVLRFSAPTTVALLGAEVAGLPAGRPLAVAAGDTLDCSVLERGARLYLAVAGGLRVPSVLGAAATHLKAGFGGMGGRALAAGDRIGYASARRIADRDGAAPLSQTWRIESPVPPPARDETVEVRLVSGVDWDRFFPAPGASREGEEKLGALRFRLSAKSDRMGLRLEGDSFAMPSDAGAAVSRPVVPGTVQLPPDGRPIVLMAEGQTIGGYPQLGQVASIDLPKLAQARPGAEIVFRLVSVSAAQQARLRVVADLNRLRVGMEFLRR